MKFKAILFAIQSILMPYFYTIRRIIPLNVWLIFSIYATVYFVLIAIVADVLSNYRMVICIIIGLSSLKFQWKRNKDNDDIIVKNMILSVLMMVLLIIINSQFIKIEKAGAMSPDIKIGQHLIVNQFAYDIRFPTNINWGISTGEIKRNDIVVVFDSESGNQVLRKVIGLPGDTISWIEGKYYKINSNGWTFSENDYDQMKMKLYQSFDKWDSICASIDDNGKSCNLLEMQKKMAIGGPIIIRSGEYFGVNNLPLYIDSRVNGPILKQNIWAKVVFNFGITK
jgi:signal peptidase I